MIFKRGVIGFDNSWVDELRPDVPKALLGIMLISGTSVFWAMPPATSRDSSLLRLR
jgi:hypothetical protein